MIMMWFNYHACASTIASVWSIFGGSHPDTIVISGLEAPNQTTTKVSQCYTLILPFLFLLFYIHHMIMMWFNYHACASTIASSRSILGGSHSHPDTIIMFGLEASLKQLLR